MKLKFLFALPILGAVISCQPANREDIRVVNVCILIHRDYPVSIAKAFRLIRDVSKEYRDSVGIIFQPIETHSFNASLAVKLKGKSFIYLDIQNITAAERKCSNHSDIRIIFTNGNLVLGNTTLGYGGIASEDEGRISIFYFDHSLRIADGSGKRTGAYTVLKHEIGHLFGLFDEYGCADRSTHSPPCNDETDFRPYFMYYSAAASEGKWNKEIIRTILRNKWRIWPKP